MDLETYVQSLIDNTQTYTGKAQIQRVISHHIPSYALQTRETEGATTPGTTSDVKILTPYAGNGFGMVCSPGAGSNVVTMPLRNKSNAVVALGKTYIDEDEIPPHKPGDFLIEHETHSKLLFQITQPAMGSDGIRNGDLLKGKTIASTRNERTFKVEIIPSDNRNLPALRNGESVYVYYGMKRSSMHEVSEKAKEEYGPGGAKFAWKTTIVLSDKTAVVSIGSATMDFPGTIPDYSDLTSLPDESFVFTRVAPTKGYALFSHYTGSGLHFEEDPDYKTILKRNEAPRTVRYNRNTMLGQRVIVKTKESTKGADDGQAITLSKHNPKGNLVLKHYSESGLKISETEPQIYGSTLKMELNFTPNPPLGVDVELENFAAPMPSAQILIEDITQNDIDVGTRMAFRHLTSAVFDEEACETDYNIEPLPQKETGHFGIDHVNKEEIALEGSGIFIRDFLRRYDEKKKGWEFVSLTEAEEYYESNKQEFYNKPDGYEIDELKRIVPASGRRDVLLREKDIKKEDSDSSQKDENAPDIHDVRLISYDENVDENKKLIVHDKKTRTDENKELIGQKGYTYKTQSENSPLKEKTFEDGYLCYPKGDIGLRHYTRSGVEVRELEPNLDYHALQATFSLFAWDNGQYFQPHHKTDEDHNYRNMKFGPYPLPLGQFSMENAKLYIEKKAPQVTEQPRFTSPIPENMPSSALVTEGTTPTDTSPNTIPTTNFFASTIYSTEESMITGVTTVASKSEMQADLKTGKTFLKDLSKTTGDTIKKKGDLGVALKTAIVEIAKMVVEEGAFTGLTSLTGGSSLPYTAELNALLVSRRLHRIKSAYDIYQTADSIGKVKDAYNGVGDLDLDVNGKGLAKGIDAIKGIDKTGFLTEYLQGSTDSERSSLSETGKAIFDKVNKDYAPGTFDTVYDAIKEGKSITNEVKMATQQIKEQLTDALLENGTNPFGDMASDFKKLLTDAAETEAESLADVKKLLEADEGFTKKVLDKHEKAVNENNTETASKQTEQNFPTLIVSHTEHPQPNIWEDGADKNRTTLALPGETATWLNLHQYSSHIQSIGKQVTLDDKRIGSRLLIRDYVMRASPEDEESSLIAAAKWENLRGEKHNLIAPKGSLELNHYTTSGLTICDKRPHYLNKVGGGHAMSMRLEMRSLDFVKGMATEPENETDDVAQEQGNTREAATDTIQKAGADALSKNIKGGKTKTIPPVAVFDKPDGTFFCEVVSNELVDKGEKYPIEIDKEGRFVKEEDSPRGKYPENPHGKRAARTGLTHDTTRSENHDIPSHVWFEDYVSEIDEEGDELDTVIQPTHLYKEKKPGETRELIMPRGYGEIQLYNKSGISLGDLVTDSKVKGKKLDDLERGKYQKAFTSLALNEWNNMRIESAETTPAAPFDEPSALLSMTCIADAANTLGQDATQVILIQKSCQQDGSSESGEAGLGNDMPQRGLDGTNRELGSALLFEDYVKEAEGSDGHYIPCHGYKDGDDDTTRLKLTFPKGKLWLQAYNHSGLFIDDRIPTDLEQQQISVCLAMREWDNHLPEQKGNPFAQDSASLIMMETSPRATKEGQRASKISLEAFTSLGKSSEHGSTLFFNDYLTDELPSHIFDTDATEGLKKVFFPKGELGLLHYNNSGLMIEDLEKTNEKTKQRVQVSLTMTEWNNTDDVGKPFDKPSTSFTMEELSPDATSQGKRASKILLEALTSKAEQSDFGSCLLIEDYVIGSEPQHVYDEGSGIGLQNLKFPKGAVTLQHYTGSGLYLTEQAISGAENHSPGVVLRLRRWKENAPENDDIAKFFAQTLSQTLATEATRIGFSHVPGDCSFYIQDSNEDPDINKMTCGINHWGSITGSDNQSSFLKFEDLDDDGEAKRVKINLHHIQASELSFDQLNLPTGNAPADMYIQLTHRNKSRLVMEDYPESGTYQFPKGGVHLAHYTNSGLYISDSSLSQEAHSPFVKLDLRTWDKKDYDATARFFAQITSYEKEKESSRIGFTHISGDSTFYIQDSNEELYNNRITCGITHWGDKVSDNRATEEGECSYLQIEDLLDEGEAKQVMIRLHHKQFSELRFEQLNLSTDNAPADMLVHLTQQSGSKLIMKDHLAKGTNDFPKGEIQAIHYTKSGLYINEQEDDEANHAPSVSLDLKTWFKKDEDPITSFFEKITSIQRADESSIIGFKHLASNSRYYIEDKNIDPNKNKIICGIEHWADVNRGDNQCSYLKFEDLTDNGEAEKVMVRLHHIVDSELRFEQLTNSANPNMLLDLRHNKKAGLKVENNDDNVSLKIYHPKKAELRIENNGDDTEIVVYHPSGSFCIFDADGSISAISVKNIKADAAETITLKAPKIKLDGDVEITGIVNAPKGYESNSNGEWHFP